MKKTLAFLLSLLLLLPLFAGCESAPEEEKVSFYPASDNTLLWMFYDTSDPDGSQPAGFFYARRPEYKDYLFSVRFGKDNVVAQDYVREWELQTYTPVVRDAYDYWEQQSKGTPYENCYAAILTSDQCQELIEKNIWVYFCLPPRPEGYSEAISDDLAVALEYLPQDTYWVQIGSRRNPITEATLTKEEILKGAEDGTYSDIYLHKEVYYSGYWYGGDVYFSSVKDGELTDQYYCRTRAVVAVEGEAKWAAAQIYLEMTGSNELPDWVWW